MKSITLIDRPCGWGKTSELIENLSCKKLYAIVVPSLSETDRIQAEAAKRGIRFHRPGIDGTEEFAGSKSDHLLKLVRDRKNIVCTHELLYRIGGFAMTEQKVGLHGPASLFSSYDLIIDEVLNPFDACQDVTAFDFKMNYVELGLAEIRSDGRVLPTLLWDTRAVSKSRTFNSKLYAKAKSGALYLHGAGLLIETFPVSLLTFANSVTVYTFLSQGSYFRLFLEKLARAGLEIDLVVDTLSTHDLATWKNDVSASLKVASIPAFEKLNLTFSGQKKFTTRKERQAVASKAGDLPPAKSLTMK